MYLLPLLDDHLAAATLTIILITEFFIDFSPDNSPEDAEGEWHQDDGEDRDEKVVESAVVVVEQLLLVSMEIVLETWHIPIILIILTTSLWCLVN